MLIEMVYHHISKSTEEHREKVVTVVDHIDHQGFHFLVA